MKCLVFDIGGNVTRYALMDDLAILERSVVNTPQGSRDDLMTLLADLYHQYSDVDGIAVSMPGIIDPVKGYCQMGGALRYNDDFYIKEALNALTGLPVTVENNAKCAALAEATAGSLQDVEDGMALFFDRMIGGGLIRGHKLYRGPHFSAGEVAYIITVRNDMPDFETVWGNRCGMGRLCRMYARVKRTSEENVSLSDVFVAVDNDELDAISCLDTFAREVAVQIFNLQTILDVSRFAIGGAACRYDSFLEAIKTNLGELYAVCPYDIPLADIVACHFADDASLIGAMQCMLDSVEG